MKGYVSMKKKRLLAYFIMIISLVISVKLVKDIYKLWHVEDRLLEANKELLEVKEVQLELKQQLGKTENDQWWEGQVRDKLMMARSNEKIAIIPEEVLNREDGDKVRREIIEKDKAVWEKWRDLFIY